MIVSGRGSICLILLSVAATGCSGGGGDGVPPTVSVSKGPGGADLLTIESDVRVDGRRPTLTLVCDSGKPASMWLDLVRPPVSPPPERDVFAQLQAKGGPEVTIELGWAGGAAWHARIPHPSQPYSDTNDRNNQQRLLPVLHAFSRERKLTVWPPANYSAGGALVWSPQTFGPHLARVQECASLEKMPDPGA